MGTSDCLFHKHAASWPVTDFHHINSGRVGTETLLGGGGIGTEMATTHDIEDVYVLVLFAADNNDAIPSVDLESLGSHVADTRLISKNSRYVYHLSKHQFIDRTQHKGVDGHKGVGQKSCCNMKMPFVKTIPLVGKGLEVNLIIQRVGMTSHARLGIALRGIVDGDDKNTGVGHRIHIVRNKVGVNRYHRAHQKAEDSANIGIHRIFHCLSQNIDRPVAETISLGWDCREAVAVALGNLVNTGSGINSSILGIRRDNEGGSRRHVGVEKGRQEGSVVD